MNIFLPYPNNVEKSVQSLDDVRLQKQAVEAYQLLTTAMKEKNGEAVKGHSHHPVYTFYKDNIDFLAYYGMRCCDEWSYRMNKEHSLLKYFLEHCNKMYDEKDRKFICPPFTPYYMENSKDSPFCIRTTRDVDMLFQQKLISKWLNDKRQPTWTNRTMPEFFEKYLRMSKAEQNKYWEDVKNFKERNFIKNG